MMSESKEQPDLQLSSVSSSIPRSPLSSFLGRNKRTKQLREERMYRKKNNKKLRMGKEKCGKSSPVAAVQVYGDLMRANADILCSFPWGAEDDRKSSLVPG